MPAVEALGLGTPVLVSGTTALPEVTMGLAAYVSDPKDVNAWVFHMESQLNSERRPGVDVIERIRSTYAPSSVAQALLATLKRREG